jgi:hypothetical protein
MGNEPADRCLERYACCADGPDPPARIEQTFRQVETTLRMRRQRADSPSSFADQTTPAARKRPGRAPLTLLTQSGPWEGPVIPWLRMAGLPAQGLPPSGRQAASSLDQITLIDHDAPN